jgi:poly(beta-D-mannuronate) lyase
MTRNAWCHVMFFMPVFLFTVTGLRPAEVRAAAPLDSPAAINAALAKATPGETILIKNGRYRDVHITLAAGGQEDRLITLAAETPGRVTFSGRSRIVLAGRYQHVTGLMFQKNIVGAAVDFENDAAQHCRLSHCAFDESGDPQSTFAHLINVGENCADNRIDHCYLARSLSMSMGTRYGAVRCRFDHNWFRDIVAKSSNGQEAIQLLGYRLAPTKPHTPSKEGDHRLFALVEWNLFDGACGDDEIISVKSDENTIRYNTFLKHPTRNQGGLVIRAGDGNIVDANCFLGTKHGIRISGQSNRITNNYMEHVTHGILMTAGEIAYRPANHNLVANNTVVAAKDDAISIGTFYGLTKPNLPGKVNNVLPTGNKFYNNILTVESAAVVTLQGNGRFADNDFQANLIARSKHRPGELPQPPGLISATPSLLVKQADRFVPGNAKLVAGQGVAIDGVKEDFAGRPRKQKPDIGCDELDAGAAVRKPLTPEDVGPDWLKGDYTYLEKSAALDELQELVRRYPDAEFRRQLSSVLEATEAQ